MFDLLKTKVRTRQAPVDRILAPVETIEPESSIDMIRFGWIFEITDIERLLQMKRGIMRLPKDEEAAVNARIRQLDPIYFERATREYYDQVSPVTRGILEEVLKRKQNRVINETINTMPRLRLKREDRFPFNAIRQPVAFPLTPEPLKKTRIVPGGAQVTTVTKAVAIRAIQPPETIQPGATVDGELLETTQVPPAPVEAGMPTFVDVALGLESPVLKYGLIALGVGLFAWSVMDTKKKPRRRSR